MSIIQNQATDWLVNASVLIGLFALLAALISPFIAKTNPKLQHCFYLAILAVCLAGPAFNTFWRVHPGMNAQRPQQHPEQQTADGSHFSFVWHNHSTAYDVMLLLPAAKAALLTIWLLLFTYQVTRFARSVYRVHRLRRDASPIILNELEAAGFTMVELGIEHPQQVPLLESTSINDPITVGTLHPAIILPRELIPALDGPDLAAILAHEYAHIHRKDFLVLLLCQLLVLPVAWHPGIQYLMSKISQTRELACDEYAATRLGKRIVYARSLLRLASLCFEAPRISAMELGIFNGDNLEERIMMLTQKKTSLSRAGLIGLALSTTFLFGSGALLARAVSLQESADANSAGSFVGTWHWMFHGQSFATMTLVQNGSQITGSATESRIALDDNGELSKADPTDNKNPVQITKTKLQGDKLYVTVGDGSQTFQFLVTHKDARHVEIHPIGAPANMKPIQAERAN